MYKKLFLITSFVLLASLFLSTAQAAPPPVRHDTNDTDLVALWHLDETGGTVAKDEIAGDNNGTLSYTRNTYAWGATGKFGTALTMGNTNTLMDARVSFSLTGMSASAGSVAMWAKLAAQPDLVSTTVRYFTGWQGSTTVGGITVDRLQLYLANSYATYSNNPDYLTELCVGIGCQNKLDQYITHLNVGDWYHIALTWKQTESTNGTGTYQAYVNGIDMPSGLMAAGYTPGWYKNLKGMSPSGSNGGQLFNNQAAAGVAKNEGGAETLDEVGFYKDAITRAEVCALAGADPNKAWNPSPDVNQLDVGKNNPTLSWSAGAGAASHDVYLGTNSASPTSQGNQTATTFGAGTLEFNKVYYWRIDERDGSPGNLTATGDLWYFKTVTGKATIPIPDNGYYNYKIPVTLAWRPGDVTNVCHDIYLGTNSADVNSSDRSGPASLVKEQAIGTTTYTPNSILLDKRYYWRIDEVISYPTLMKGDLWTFTSSPIFYADDFQSYASTTALKNTWKGTGNTNNAWIYQDVSGTDKAVCLWYDNATSPYYAGIKRSVPGAQGTSRDYTFGGTGASVRVSYVVGPNNPALYVSLFNVAGTQSTKVKQPIDTMTPQPPIPPLPPSYTWKEVWLKLSDFNGAVTTNVGAIEVGDGNRAAPLGGQGNMYFDDIKIQAKEYIGLLESDLNSSHDVNYVDLKKITLDSGATWLDPPVSLVKNGGMNKGTWGTQPSDQPDAGHDPCSVNWPKYWYLWCGTTNTEDANYVLSVDKADPKTKTCARVDLDGPTTKWNDGGLCQVMDVNDYNNQELLVSFMHKGDITAQDNCMFEYRPTMDGCSTNDKAGAPMLKRVQRGGKTTCGDCYGLLSWDWEPYTHIMTIDVSKLDSHDPPRKSRYLHLHFRLAGRQDSTANPPQYLKIDSVVVTKKGDTLPVGDITVDGIGEVVKAVDFTDFAVMANEWLITQPSIP